MAAEIQVNGFPGSNDNITLGATVTLSNSTAATNYLWTLLSQPSGSTVVLSSTSAAAVTFPATKEGSYLVRLVTDVGLPTQAQDQVIVAVRELQTGNRIPAAGETLENNAATGWANTAVDQVLRRVTQFTDAGVVSGVAGEELLAGDVVYASGTYTLASGLPGSRVVPKFVSAQATSAAAMKANLGIVLGTATGSSTAPLNAPIRVLMSGSFATSGIDNSVPVGSPIYVDNDGYLSGTPGTIVRQVGQLYARVSGSEYVWISGDADTDTPATTTGLGSVQLAGGLGGTGTTATVPKLDMDHAVSGTLAAARQAPQTLVGDVDGPVNANEVLAVRGFEYDSADPQVGQVPTWNGTKFVYASPSGGGSGGGGVIYYFNSATAGQAPVVGLNGSPKQLGLVDQPTLGTIPSGTLSQGGTYTLVAGFVTDVSVPSALEIPGGVWDVVVWANSTTASANQIGVRAKLYKYNGTTPTLISTSATVWMSSPSVVTELTGMSLTVPANTPLLATDRIYITLEATATANNQTVTFSFGDGYPSHVHTTLPSVTGTGVMTVVNGIPQSPAGPISLASSTYVTGTLPIGNGGTGLTSAGGVANRVMYTTDGSSFTVGQLPNAALANSSVTVTAGTGLTGGGSVALGGSVTLSVTDAGRVVLSSTNVALDDPSDQIPTTHGYVRVNSVTTGSPPLVLTSTPTINTTGVSMGTVLMVSLVNGADSFTISADSTITPGGVAGTKVVLKGGATTKTFNACDAASFLYDGAFWCEL